MIRCIRTVIIIGTRGRSPTSRRAITSPTTVYYRGVCNYYMPSRLTTLPCIVLRQAVPVASRQSVSGLEGTRYSILHILFKPLINIHILLLLLFHPTHTGDGVGPDKSIAINTVASTHQSVSQTERT